jgi:hypothetical protein
MSDTPQWPAQDEYGASILDGRRITARSRGGRGVNAYTIYAEDARTPDVAAILKALADWIAQQGETIAVMHVYTGYTYAGNDEVYATAVYFRID